MKIAILVFTLVFVANLDSYIGSPVPESPTLIEEVDLQPSTKPSDDDCKNQDGKAEKLVCEICDSPRIKRMANMMGTCANCEAPLTSIDSGCDHCGAPIRFERMVKHCDSCDASIRSNCDSPKPIHCERCESATRFKRMSDPDPLFTGCNRCKQAHCERCDDKPIRSERMVIEESGLQGCNHCKGLHCDECHKKQH